MGNIFVLIWGVYFDTLLFQLNAHRQVPEDCQNLNLNISKIRKEKEIIKLSRTLQLSVTTKFQLSVHYQDAVCFLANLQFCLKKMFSNSENSIPVRETPGLGSSSTTLTMVWTFVPKERKRKGGAERKKEGGRGGKKERGRDGRKEGKRDAKKKRGTDGGTDGRKERKRDGRTDGKKERGMEGRKERRGRKNVFSAWMNPLRLIRPFFHLQSCLLCCYGFSCCCSFSRPSYNVSFLCCCCYYC